jgi:tetratricopeptide (TPR) repeat protein
MMLGGHYASLNQLDRAVAEFERVVALDPRSVPANTMLALLLQQQNRMKEAEATYRRVLAFSPRAPVAANNLAWLYANAGGDLDVALQLAQIAKEQLPENPDVNDTLAWVYYQRGLPEMAIPLVALALERSPDTAIYHYHLGLMYLKRGDSDLARRSLERALAAEPRFEHHAEARRLLGTLQ